MLHSFLDHSNSIAADSTRAEHSTAVAAAVHSKSAID